MTRSLKKGIYLNQELLTLTRKELLKKKIIETQARSSTITAKFIGTNIKVYNGQKYKKIFITQAMIGHKLGEFVFTTPIGSKIHFKKKKKKIMGHLVNPKLFRLGVKIDWNSIWCIKKKNKYINWLVEDFIIYKFIDYSFIHKKLHGTFQGTKTEIANAYPTELEVILVKSKLIRSQTKIILLILLYRPPLSIIYKNKIKKTRREIKKNKRKIRKYNYKNKLYKFHVLKYKYEFTLKSFFEDYMKFFKVNKTNNKFTYKVLLSFRNKNIIKYIGFIKLKKIIKQPIKTKKLYINYVERIIIINKILFKRFKILYQPKVKFFYIKILMLNLIKLINKSILRQLKEKTRIYWLFLIRKLFKRLIKYQKKNNKIKYQTQIGLYWKSLLEMVKGITITINKITKAKTKTIIKFVDGKKITPKMITQYLGIKISRGFKFMELFRPLKLEFKRLRKFHGFKIVVAGRLTRKQRASFEVKRWKSVPLNTKMKLIEYGFNTAKTKFGQVGIKLWFNRIEKKYYKEDNWRLRIKKRRRLKLIAIKNVN